MGQSLLEQEVVSLRCERPVAAWGSYDQNAHGHLIAPKEQGGMDRSAGEATHTSLNPTIAEGWYDFEM